MSELRIFEKKNSGDCTSRKAAVPNLSGFVDRQRYRRRGDGSMQAAGDPRWQKWRSETPAIGFFSYIVQTVGQSKYI